MNNGLETALSVARIADLPPAIDDGYKKHWIKAIVKVQRSNGDTGFCLAVNDGANNPSIIRDFNPTGIIAAVLSVYPYEEAERSPIPRFRSDEQIVKYLCKYGYDRAEVLSLLTTDGKTDEQAKNDKEILKGYIAKVANKQAQAKSNSDEQAKMLVAMADPKIIEKKTKTRKYGRTAQPKAKRSKS